MTQEQFIEALIEMGYKLETQSNSHNPIYIDFKKRNKNISIQEWHNQNGNIEFNIYFMIVQKTYRIEHIQFYVTDFAKALRNIRKFEKGLER